MKPLLLMQLQSCLILQHKRKSNDYDRNNKNKNNMNNSNNNMNYILLFDILLKQIFERRNIN